MSLDQHSIDKGYRARLGKLEVAPPAHAWAAIAAQLPNDKADEKGIWWWGTGASTVSTPEEKSKRERILFWWWTGALVALATISLLAYYGINASTSNNSNPNQNQQPSKATLVPIAASNNQDFLNEGRNVTSKNDEDCPEVTAINTAIAATPASNRQAIALSNNAQTATSTVHSTYRNNVVAEINLSATTTAQSANGAFVTASQTTEATLPTDTKQAAPPSTPNPLGLSMTSIAMSELPFNDLMILETTTTKLPFGPGFGCEDFKNRADWSFAVRVFGGPGMVFQDYASSDQTSPYAVLRDCIENDQMSMHGGLRFEAVNDRGLFLRAGADYQMYRTNVESLGPRRSRTITDSVFMEDTGTWRVETRNESYQEKRNVYNRQHAVVLTAGVGFRKTFGNVSPYIMAEAGYELLFKRRGDFVLPDGNFVDLAEDDNGLYINDRPGFQYGGVIGVDFALTDRIEAGISGHYKQLGGLRGSADLLDYDQSTAFGAFNLRYTIR